MTVLERVFTLAALPLLAGCGAGAPFHPTTPTEAIAAGSPLGPSYVLVPLPRDDDGLLGRVLFDVPANGQSLEGASHPNDCADKLAPKKEEPLAGTFEDAQELAAGGKARATLGAFGFEADAPTATHFHYKLDVSKRITQDSTTAYLACCKDKGTCGYGFVAALVYGDGQYATLAQSDAPGGVPIPVGGAGDFVMAKSLHQRSVHGYLAALVAVTDPKPNRSIGVLGDPAAAGITLTEQDLPEPARKRFDRDKILVVARGSGPVETAYVFEDGHGEITENEFVRRYRALTGSHELDGAERGRRKGLLVAGLLVATASTTVAVGMLSASECTQDQGGGCNRTGAALAVGAGGALIGIGLATWAALTSDGSASDHVLTKADADLYAARHNRSLLRKGIQDTPSQARPPWP